MRTFKSKELIHCDSREEKKNMKTKIIGILVCMLLIATAILPLVSALETRSPLLAPGVVDQQQPNTPELHWLDIHRLISH